MLSSRLTKIFVEERMSPRKSSKESNKLRHSMVSPLPARYIIPNEALSEPDDATKETLGDYAKHSTTHGVAYIFEEDVRMLSRIVWTVVTLGLMGLAIALILSAYNAWNDNPVLTSVKDTASPISDIEFPAITLCGLGSMDKVIDQALVHQIRGHLKTHGINVSSEIELEEILDTYGSKYLPELYPGINFSPKLIAELSATLSPDEYVKAQILVGGLDNSNCSAEKDQDTDMDPNFNPCEPNIYDSKSKMCYLFDSKSEFLDDADKHCYNRDYMTVLNVRSNEQMMELGNLVKSGNFPEVQNSIRIWTDITKDGHGNLKLYNGETLLVKNFSSLATGNISNPQKLCVTAKWRSKQGRFALNDALCDGDLHPSICSKPADATPYCGNSGPNTDPSNLLEVLLEPNKRISLDQKLSLEKELILEDYNLMNQTVAYRNFFELLWYTQLPCFDSTKFSNFNHERSMLKRCIWKGVDLPCSSLFKTFPTDRGMCCTFNMEAAEVMLKESNYVQQVTRLQNVDRMNSFGYQEYLPGWYTNNSEPVPVQGIENGLTVLLDAHTDYINPSSVGEDFDGFLALVAPSNHYPLIRKRNMRIRPGHENLVAISAVDVKVSSDFQTTLSPEDRNCYFPDEGYDSVLYRSYSQESCIMECQMTYVVNTLAQDGLEQCTPWYLPLMGNMSVCDPWMSARFRSMMLDASARELCSHCKSDCQSTRYSTSVSAVPFRNCDNKNLGISTLCNVEDKNVPMPGIFGTKIWNQFHNPNELPLFASRFSSSLRHYTSDNTRLNEVFSESYNKPDWNTYDAYEKDIALVHFYFESPTIFTYYSKPSLTWVGFFSQVGGLLGLCIGFSLCSGIEIIYWFGFRIWCNVVKIRRKPRK